MKVKSLLLVPCVVLLGLLSSVALAQAPNDEPAAPAAQLIARWTAGDAICRSATPAARCYRRLRATRHALQLLALANYCTLPAAGGPTAWMPCTARLRARQAAATAHRAVPADGRRVRAVGADERRPQVYFIVDSGAATIQVPEEAAEELRRNGTLTEADFMGQHRFILADGRTMQQRVFRLRSLQLGERTMENVLATVGAPKSRALLGQSFLKRLNWWKIDNVNKAMEFEFTGAF